MSRNFILPDDADLVPCFGNCFHFFISGICATYCTLSGIEETLTYYAFPSEHWLKIRTNNMLERLNREIRRRTRVVGTFPDGESALMLVCARLRHVAGTQWGVKRYMSMKSLEQMDREKHGADCCDLA